MTRFLEIVHSVDDSKNKAVFFVSASIFDVLQTITNCKWKSSTQIKMYCRNVVPRACKTFYL